MCPVEVELSGKAGIRNKQLLQSSGTVQYRPLSFYCHFETVSKFLIPHPFIKSIHIFFTEDTIVDPEV